MSDPSRQKLIRAVRLLPGTVKIGIFSDKDNPPDPIAENAAENLSAVEDGALKLDADGQQSRIRQLNERIIHLEEQVQSGLESCERLKNDKELLRGDLEKEKAAFYARRREEEEGLRDAARKTGHSEGFSAGHAEGLQSAEQELRESYNKRFTAHVALLEGIHSALSAEKETLFCSFVPQLVSLWETMLERMLLEHVSLDPTLADRVVRDIVGRISDREKIIVYLHPDDLPLLDHTRDELLDSLRGIRHFEFVGDAHVDKGSCLVETGMGIYDARWRTQLEQIHLQVRQLLKEGGETGAGSGNGTGQSQEPLSS